MRVHAVSENAVLVEFGQEIDEALIPVIAAATAAIWHHLGAVIVDVIPSYTTLLCVYDYNQVDSHWMVQAIRNQAESSIADAQTVGKSRLVEIPVWYDAAVGYDLESLAQSKALSTDKLVELHTGRDYQVFAIGFNPGFAFLGRLHERLATPRHASPRKSVPAGSVGIADAQTAVYPLPSPGGWQILGRTPQAMFDVSLGENQASLLAVGDRVRFVSIDRAEFLALGGHLND